MKYLSPWESQKMKWKSSSSVNSTLNKSGLRAAAIITAAGTSSRMGNTIKKEFLPLDGKPVLLHTVERFLDTGLFFMCGVTFREDEESEMIDILRPLLEGKRITMIRGGDTRQKSVLNGLEALVESGPLHVLIHDGARPWVSEETVRLVLDATVARGAAAPVVPAVNALKVINEDGVLQEHLSRETVMGVQTPQGFGYQDILQAHRKAASDGMAYIDDTEIYSRYCGNVYAVPGDPNNRKITYSHDMGAGS
jgi:2-C-methyl-D-erythritol 4-phosphate cytidylyltransferase